MCLYTTQEKTKIAKKDITCYKALTCKLDNTTNDIVYMSPFYDFYWYRNKPNKTYTYIANTSWWIDHGKEDKALSNIGYYDAKGDRHPQYQVHSGYFHTYKFLTDAEDMYKKNAFDKLVIVKCIIPKNSEFYEGIDSNGSPSYASPHLRIIEQIL